MYIRRKVFSVAIDAATGEEKLFSVNEVMNAETYQKTFAKKEEEEEEKKSRKVANGAAKGAAATAGAAGVGAVGVYGAKKLTDRGLRKAIENKRALEEGKVAFKEGLPEKLEAAHEKAAKRSRKVSEPIQKAKDWITNKAGKQEAEAYKAGMEGKKLSGAAKKAAEEKLARLEKVAAKGARNRKIGVGLAAAGALAAGAGTGALIGKKKSEK